MLALAFCRWTYGVEPLLPSQAPCISCSSARPSMVTLTRGSSPTDPHAEDIREFEELCKKSLTEPMLVFPLPPSPDAKEAGADATPTSQ